MNDLCLYDTTVNEENIQEQTTTTTGTIATGDNEVQTKVNEENLLTTTNESSAAIAIENAVELDSIVADEDEEIRQAQTAFSQIIDKACSNEPISNGNIFEHTYIPQESFGFIFRSMIPKREILKQVLLTRDRFNYHDRENMKYTFQVLDRRTNHLIYEQVPTYHKYAMKLIFTGPVQRELLHTNAIINFFARETLRLGDAFDEPKSRKYIPTFVKTYQINLGELLEPNIYRYFTFNEFFYRKLRPNTRPIAHMKDPSVIVSAADCRLMLFNNINDATHIWIKGRQFSLRFLFEDEKLAREFDGGSIAVFRLAPDDYHRFHSPIHGRMGPIMKQITGTYYTVNPIAIQANLDVLTRNQRTITTIESDCFEKIAFVAIGALLVGSVNFTVKPNQFVQKGDELGKMKLINRNLFDSFILLYLGYFAYGGSTVVVIFKAGLVQWDDDLLHNSNNAMETLVRMGERIGQRTNEQQQKESLLNDINPTMRRRNSTISKLLSYFPISTAKNKSN